MVYRLYANLYQNVHEGPMGIGTRVQYTEVPIAAGNVISDGEKLCHVVILL
jgi:hypothetical protein